MIAPATGSVGYGYDARGLRTRITYPDTSVIDYSYLPDGRLYQTQQLTTTLATYEYTARGEPANIFRANGVNSTFGFDAAARLRSQHTTTLSGTVSEYIYTTDRRGLRTAADETWTARDSADAGTGTGLFGEYYSDTGFGTLVLTRTDSLIDFDWALGSPDTAVPDEGFSVRWTGTVQPRYTEAYTFTTTADDGVRLWVNGDLLIDDWNPHPPEEHSGPTSVALTAGQQYTITLEYFEDSLTAEVQLEWQSVRQGREIIPTSQLYAPGVSAPEPLVTTGLGRNLTYGYDGLQRLTDVQEVGPTATTAYSYTYDLAGNRLDAWTDGILVQNRTYDDANQVSGWAYDAAGNLLDDGIIINTWDALNRLTVQGATTNAYNGDGVLVAQTTGSGTISYTQDLAAPLSQILSDGTNTYVYGADRLFGVAGGTRTWYLGDALGSVRQTLDDAGVVQQALSYDAWGVPQGAAIAPFGYTGELQQGNQVYLRARWYHAGTGTFGSRDPFAGMAEIPYSLHPYASYRWQTKEALFSKPYSLHPYQYAYSNPLIFTDATGNSPDQVTPQEGIAIGLMIERDFIDTIAPSLGYAPGQIQRQFKVNFASKEHLTFDLNETDNGLRLDIKGDRTYKPGFVDLIDLVRKEIYEVKSIKSEPLGRAELQWYLSFLPGYQPGEIQYSPSPRTIGPWPTDPQYEVRAEIRRGVIVYWGVKKERNQRRIGSPVIDPYALSLLCAAGLGAYLGHRAGQDGRVPEPNLRFWPKEYLDNLIMPQPNPLPHYINPGTV